MGHNIDRRQFLSTGAGLLGLLASGTFSPALRAQTVQDDYRALVLVFQLVVLTATMSSFPTTTGPTTSTRISGLR